VEVRSSNVSEYPIPPLALARLRAAYEQFQLVAQIVADTLELPPGARRVEFDRGVFVVNEHQSSSNGAVSQEVST
jgi:hypothetical protein